MQTRVIWNHALIGHNGDCGVVVVSLVVRVTEKEQEHAPALESA